MPFPPPLAEGEDQVPTAPPENVGPKRSDEVVRGEAPMEIEDDNPPVDNNRDQAISSYGDQAVSIYGSQQPVSGLGDQAVGYRDQSVRGYGNVEGLSYHHHHHHHGNGFPAVPDYMIDDTMEVGAGGTMAHISAAPVITKSAEAALLAPSPAVEAQDGGELSSGTEVVPLRQPQLALSDAEVTPVHSPASSSAGPDNVASSTTASAYSIQPPKEKKKKKEKVKLMGCLNSHSHIFFLVQYHMINAL